MSGRCHLVDITRGQIIGNWLLKEGQNVTSMSQEFVITHTIISRAWTPFQSTERAVGSISSSRLRATTIAEDRYVVLQSKKKYETDSRRNRKADETDCWMSDIAFYRG